MSRKTFLVLLGVALVSMWTAAPATAAFGLKELDLTYADGTGSSALSAGSHPFSLTTNLAVNTAPDPDFTFELPEGEVKDIVVDLPPGLVGTPTPVPRCSDADFTSPGAEPETNNCPDAAALGIAEVTINEPDEVFTAPIYNLFASPGTAARFGFFVIGVPVTIVAGVNPDPPYNVVVRSNNVLSQVVRFYSARLTFWGVPADGDHDEERGDCIKANEKTGESCPANVPPVPFLTLPTRCEGPLATKFKADAWQSPNSWFEKTILSHDNSVPPNPLATSGCESLAFDPRIEAQPTSRFAESPSGLDFNLEIDDEGLMNPDGSAASHIKKAVVTLPEGVTANPSLAQGLAACSEADLRLESADSEPGVGCPEASKIGTVEVETPLLEGELLKGSLFLATPHENLAQDSLIALYMVIQDPELGILVRLPGRVEPDPASGRLVTTFGEAPYELPQVPFSDFRFHFREGGRSPLITPGRCGDYTVEAKFTPWANPSSPLTTTSTFKVTSGVGGGPCPPPGAQPFDPAFTAGSLNNDAGSYTPFYMRLTRRDGDQDLTRFDATLPPGLLAKLAGTTQCPDSQIAAAKAKSGREELAAPSCPASSELGNVLSGAGVGSQLIYVPGKIYLGGPVGGAPLSVVGIVPAVAGPFDVGTVVVRQALQVDRRSAEVRVDGAVSDPIPHILAGIPLRVRDIQVNVDRPQFTLNPTSCNPFTFAAELWGGGLDPFSRADDAPASRSERFQAANCARLGFKPRLSLRLKGGTKRGDHPAFRGVYRPRKGDANLAGMVLRLPRSAFLEQGHIRTICTRVQFAADACPGGSVYGRAKVFTPLLEKPLTGPVYLRSSNNELPDLIFDLRGLVNFEAVFRIDSQNGGIRATLSRAPDAPIEKAVVNMLGGKKGLIVNSTNLCSANHRANVKATGHNGKTLEINPLVTASCAKKR